MIWFFIAGWICGVVAVIMVIQWWIRTHMVRVSKEELMDEIENEEEKSND